MRKQYDFYETVSFKYEVVLYYDGVKVDVVKKWSTELYDYLDSLEAEGYTKGYTKDYVEEAYKRYMNCYENRIERD